MFKINLAASGATPVIVDPDLIALISENREEKQTIVFEKDLAQGLVLQDEQYVTLAETIARLEAAGLDLVNFPDCRFNGAGVPEISSNRFVNPKNFHYLICDSFDGEPVNTMLGGKSYSHLNRLESDAITPDSMDSLKKSIQAANGSLIAFDSKDRTSLFDPAKARHVYEDRHGIHIVFGYGQQNKICCLLNYEAKPEREILISQIAAAAPQLRKLEGATDSSLLDFGQVESVSDRHAGAPEPQITIYWKDTLGLPGVTQADFIIPFFKDEESARRACGELMKADVKLSSTPGIGLNI